MKNKKMTPDFSLLTLRSALLGFAFLPLCLGQTPLSTVAGTGTTGFSGDGGPATAAMLSSPLAGLAVDGAGNVYIADVGNDRVRKVTPAGTISTYAGNGKPGTTGDNGPATSAQLYNALSISWAVQGMAADAAGNVYIVDNVNRRVRKVTSAGIISTFAGGGLLLGDGGPAALAELPSPTSVAVDTVGNVYIVDGLRVRKVNTAGIISTVAGNGVPSYNGDDGLAVNAAMEPESVTVDSAGNLFITEFVNGVIRKVDTAGMITTIAGMKSDNPSSGDGGPAIKAVLQNLHGVAVDGAGNIFLIDSPYIRKIDTSGIITTVMSPYGTGPDGGKVSYKTLTGPAAGLTFDAAGNLYLTEYAYVQKLAAPPPPAPVISPNGIVSGASFQPGIVANSWVTIQGASLAARTDNWSNSIANGALPTSLGGVSVSMGGKAAYVYFISPGQLNVLAPDVPPGPLTVTVTTAGGTSANIATTASAYGPAFFVWPGNQVVATRQDYSYAVKAGTFAGATTVAAKPGDVIVLWATGFGPTHPAPPAGVAVPGDQTYATSSMPSIAINNMSATVYGAALAPGSVGLYQIAMQVPPSLADGDWPIQAVVGGVLSPVGTILSVHQ
jgi:uncharacterized protein (TIGR03437 family)